MLRFLSARANEHHDRDCGQVENNMNDETGPDRAATTEDLSGSETGHNGRRKDNVNTVHEGEDHSAAHHPSERAVAQQRVGDDAAIEQFLAEG
ncbi:MAG: hypothetical protein CLLPBCKN_006653 [Chroococcidiopsis cubana SAG 39.79]|nr:hypothetical protein [Chroococcidiopsis cubana SAG 39.79]